MLRQTTRSLARLSLRTDAPCLASRAQSTLASSASAASETPSTTQSPSTSTTEVATTKTDDLPLPRSLQALHLQPLKREAKYGFPSCDLQLRSYSVRPLEFFADFALRAAYYLGLPALGPVPLPRITERWTVPRDHFIFKKAQENFERRTMRRLIQIQDGDPETVQIWLAYLRKHQYYGIGMKANVWEYGKVGAEQLMEPLSKEEQAEIDSKWAHLGQTKTIGTPEKVEELLSQRRFHEAAGLKEPPTTGN